MYCGTANGSESATFVNVPVAGRVILLVCEMGVNVVIDIYFPQLFNVNSIKSNDKKLKEKETR